MATRARQHVELARSPLATCRPTTARDRRHDIGVIAVCKSGARRRFVQIYLHHRAAPSARARNINFNARQKALLASARMRSRRARTPYKIAGRQRTARRYVREPSARFGFWRTAHAHQEHGRRERGVRGLDRAANRADTGASAAASTARARRGQGTAYMALAGLAARRRTGAATAGSAMTPEHVARRWCRQQDAVR